MPLNNHVIVHEELADGGTERRRNQLGHLEFIHSAALYTVFVRGLSKKDFVVLFVAFFVLIFFAVVLLVVILLVVVGFLVPLRFFFLLTDIAFLFALIVKGVIN